MSKSQRNDDKTFWQNVIKTDSCWLWNGSVHDTGYGRMSFNGRGVFAHRYVMGNIPDGLTVDHLCCNKLCVNPAHLELVSRGENARRYWLGRKACKHGHEFTPENTRIDKKGRRCCRACNRRHYHERAERLKGSAS